MNSAALVTTPATQSATIEAATVPPPPPETTLHPDDTFSMAHLALFSTSPERQPLFRVKKSISGAESIYVYQPLTPIAPDNPSIVVEVPHTTLTTEPPPPKEKAGASIISGQQNAAAICP